MSQLTTVIKTQKYKNLVLLFIYLFSLTAIPFTEVSNIFRAAVLILSLPILISERKIIFKDSMLKILGLIIIIQIISWVHASITLPEITSTGPKIDRLAKLFLFFFIAYWLNGSIKKTYLLLATLMIGFTLGCILNANFTAELFNGLHGERVDFSIKNAQFTSMFAGLSTLISGFFLFQLAYNKEPFDKFKYSHKLILFVFLTASLLFFLLITVITQSRQTWLALLITIFLTPIFYMFTVPQSNKKKILLSYFVIFSIFVGVSQSKIVQSRINTESTTIQHIMSGDLDHIPMTSIGIRVNSWLAATEWIKRSPFIGNDVNAIKEVIQQSDKFSKNLKQRFGHLHSFHIEVLVAYGIAGLLIIYSLYYWLIRSLFILKKEQYEFNNHLILFAIIFLSFWFIVNCFETFNSRSLGVYAHNIMCAVFYTFYLSFSLRDKNK